MGLRPRSQLALRVGAGLGVVLLLFVVALLVTLKAYRNIEAAESEVARLDHAKHAGHGVAAMVRELHLQQAHLLLSQNPDSLTPYQTGLAAAHEATHHLVTTVPSYQDRQEAQAIRSATQEIEKLFSATVLSALKAGNYQKAIEAQDQVEERVRQVVHQVHVLNHHLEERAQTALEAAREVRASAWQVTVTIFALAFLAAVATGWILMRSIEKPIEVLRSGALRIAQGDLVTPIHWPYQDEFSELAETFNQMSAQLEQKQAEKLSRQRLELLERVTAGVAHELNNPLGVILGYLKLMKRDGSYSEERFAIVEDEARQCQRLVEDLREVVRPPEIKLSPVELRSLLRDTCARLAQSDSSQGIALSPPPAGDEAWVLADESRLRQVLGNLLTNAVQAVQSQEQGQVRLELSQVGENYLLQVFDNGPGVATEDLERIFDPFYTTKQDGTGLGLALSRSLMEAQQGQLTFEASPEGSCFQISLQRAKAPEYES